VTDRDRIMQLKKDGHGDEALALFDSGFAPHTQQYVDKVHALLDMQHAAIDERAQNVLANRIAARPCRWP